MRKTIYLMFFTFLLANFTHAQEFESIVKNYLNHQTAENFHTTDISDISISSESFSKSLDAHTVYVDQNFQGIRIFNSVSPFIIQNGKVRSAQLSFLTDIAGKTNGTQPSINATTAISRTVSQLGLPTPAGLQLLETKNNHSYIFNDGNISLENIPVELVYHAMYEGESLRLAWDLSIYLLDGSHYYSVRIDALNGQILEVFDLVLSCNFGDHPHAHGPSESVLMATQSDQTYTPFNTNTPQYRVFPIPLNAPNEGTDQLITDPSDSEASPFGWHDTDGQPGHEYTTTRGNNVLANEDHGGYNIPGELADGGEEMLFDFAFDLPRDPMDFTDAAITNLFYMNNIMHDVFYKYGFDEASGNFQQNNYGKGGSENDYVIADAQDGYGMNNANFGTPPDGQKPRMQMFLWTAPGEVIGSFLTVNNGPLAGSYNTIGAEFGPSVPTSGITKDLVLIKNDNSGTSEDPSDGCGEIINAAEINGKIAVVRRGQCDFVAKVEKAQDAGAVAVIVVNNAAGDPIAMGGTNANITIPAIMIYQTDGENLIDLLEDGQTVNATLKDDGSGNDPFRRDGDLDNGIIAHEYGHGISTRLTGGRNNVYCLFNEEQMGEGWSDYFGLVLTMKPGDQATDSRGIGTYATGQGRYGTGIRTFAYSTDFGVNPFTYNNIKSQAAPHGVGSVWATMLWDLTWAFVDEYGFDEDIYEGTGGNNMALQLVVDGLKLQPCNPGFVDGRDAILQADEIANDGENECLIWHAFAKRGLGYSAQQGSTNSKSDGTEAFDVPQTCALGVGNNDNIKNKFVVYPNPSQGEINIQSRFGISEAQISIFDMNGRLIVEQEVEMHNTGTINASNLTPGIYMIKIEGGGFNQTTKLIMN